MQAPSEIYFSTMRTMAKQRKTRKRTESRPASSQMAAAMGRAIQVVRTDRGWSRKDFAERTGLSYSFLSEIENGVKEPSSRTFALISNALDVAPGALLYDAERRLSEVPDASPSPSVSARYAAARQDSGPAIQRSRRVLDWLAGPLARRSSEDSDLSQQTQLTRSPASPQEQTELALADAEFGSTGSDSSGVGVDEFLTDLLPLLSELSPDDRELVLDLARRLARVEGS
jgi:transcriptional regulator with XRE-family HTH domain